MVNRSLLIVLFLTIALSAQSISPFSFLWADSASSSSGEDSGSLFSISNISFDSVTLDASATENALSSIDMSPDGDILYLAGNGTELIHQYNLSTPFNLNTAVYDTNYSIGSEENSVRGFIIKDDGTSFYIVGRNGDAVFQYDMITPFDVSSASLSGSKSHGLNTNAGYLFFNADGSKLFVENFAEDFMYETALSIPYDIGTAGSFTFAYDIGALVGQDVAYCSIVDDGKVLLTRSSTTETIYQVNFATAYDFDTVTLSPDTYLYSADIPSSLLMGITYGGGKVIIPAHNRIIYQFTYTGD